MDPLIAIMKRRSKRTYLQKPVEFDKITALLEAGHAAPSAGGLQDWKFIVITEKAIQEEIANHCMEQYWMAQAPVMIVVCAHQERSETHFGLRGKRLYCIQDCAAAAQNMLIAAELLGLSACWVGAFDEDFLSQKLSIPQSARAQIILTIGYSGEKPSEKEESELRSCVYFNQYGNTIENIHTYLRDYSVEWEKQSKQAEPAINKGVEKLKEGVKKLKEQVAERAVKKK